MPFLDALVAGDARVRTHLGESVTYDASVGVPVVVSGIFDAAYLREELGQPGIATAAPAVWIAEADLPATARTDFEATLTIRGQVYAVNEVKPDNQGSLLFLLHLA